MISELATCETHPEEPLGNTDVARHGSSQL